MVLEQFPSLCDTGPLVAVYDVILPAGGRIAPPFSLQAGVDSKALIDFGGQTILARVLNALADSGKVGRTVLVGTPEVLAHRDAALASDLVEAGLSLTENLYRGLDFLLGTGSTTEKVLVVPTDIPFLTGGIVNHYLEGIPLDKDILVPLVQRHEYEARFPGSTSTFVDLKGGAYTLGGLFVMAPHALQKSRSHLDHVIEQRKSKLGMAKLLGPIFVAKWLSKTLTLAEVEKKIQTMLHISGSAVLGVPPELAYDIDDQVDYDYAMDLLRKSSPVATGS
jgi:GTP:adenosylcobinamide-phosphate guanylyltransferase